MKPNSHVGANEFKSIGWLPVSGRVDQIILNHVLKSHPDSRPIIWLKFFIVHSYGSRFRESGNFFSIL